MLGFYQELESNGKHHRVITVRHFVHLAISCYTARNQPIRRGYKMAAKKTPAKKNQYTSKPKPSKNRKK